MNIKALLKKMEDDLYQNNIIPEFILLYNAIDYIILKIKGCKTTKDAEPYFDQLNDIQLMTAKFNYKYHIDLPVNLEEFSKAFDNLHDLQEREKLFYEIQQGKYWYEQYNDGVVLHLLEDIVLQDKQDISFDAEALQSQLDFLQQEVIKLLEKIKICNGIKDTQHYFDGLQKIQGVLALLLFKYSIPMSAQLKKFVRDCDRLDDVDLRHWLFTKLQQGCYSLDSACAPF